MKKIVLLISLCCGISVVAQQRMKDYSRILYSKSIYEIDAFLRDAHPDDPKRAVLKPRLMDLINDYLKRASPEDQRVPELQEKLAMLKRRPSTKITFEEMNANIRKKQIEYYQRKLKELENAKNHPIASIPKQEESVEKTETNKANNSEKIKAEKERLLSMNTASHGAKTSAPLSNPSASTKTIAASTATSSMMNASEADEFKMLMNESPEDHKRKTVGLLNKLFDNDPSSKEVIVMIENKSDCDMIMRIEGVGYTKFRLAIPAHNENSIVIPKGSYLFSSLVCGAQYSSQKSVQKNIIVSLSNPK